MNRSFPRDVVDTFILILMLAFVGCGHDDSNPLPTVQVPPDPASIVTCQDFQGVRPDRRVSRVKAERSPRFCFMGCDCFYNCPRD